jgi:hypothetical protein
MSSDNDRSWTFQDSVTGKWKVVIEGVLYPLPYDDEASARRAMTEGVKLLNEGVK